MTSEGAVQNRSVRTVSAGRLTAQVLLAAAALFLFGWLINVLLNHPDAGTGGMARGSWIVLLLILLAIVLVAMLLMSDLVLDRLRGVDKVPVSPDEDHVIIGCPACGTVFGISETQATGQEHFACHNCGREGYVRDHNLNRKRIRMEHCNTCGTDYQEYKEFSECPNCHTYNEY